MNRSLALAALAVIASMLGLRPSIAAAQTAMCAPQAEQNRRIIASAFDRWAAGGTGFFNEVVSPDVVWTIEGSGPSAGAYQGRNDFVARAIQPFAARMRTPNRPVSRTVWADGDHVIVRWEGRGVANDGRPYQNDYVWIFRMCEGLGVEVTAFLDLPRYDDIRRRVPVAADGGRP